MSSGARPGLEGASRDDERYLFSGPARRDLAEIWDFIARDDVRAADQILNYFEAAARTLSTFPKLGHERVDLADEPLRLWPVESYVIVYRSAARPIEILRILHVARDIEHLLD